MKVKYNRISGLDQNLNRQEMNSSDFDKIYSDKTSGTIPFFERNEASKLVDDVKKKKIKSIHVSSIDRLGRNVIDILIVQEFFNDNEVPLYIENLGMYSMVDGKVNPTFKLIQSVLANVAEMERNTMLERQREGIEAAKLLGVYRGRLLGTKMTDEDFLEKHKVIAKELRKGESLRRAAKLGQSSLGTAQKVKRLINIEVSK